MTLNIVLNQQVSLVFKGDRNLSYFRILLFFLNIGLFWSKSCL